MAATDPRVVRYDDPASFLARAEPWLLAREAVNNIPLSIVGALGRGELRCDEPPFLATVEGPAGVEGCAFRTPPFNLSLTALPPGGAARVADAVAALYSSLPGVVGPEPDALAFASAWAARTGAEHRVRVQQRLYRLDRVVPPSRPAPGACRAATQADLDLVETFAAGFLRDIGDKGFEKPRSIAQRLLSGGEVFLWEDGAPCAIAAANGRTAHGVRVGLVYSPPESRRRGYASTLVAEVSTRLLSGGARFCVLFTDLSNPTSNGIYQAIGYRPLFDVSEVEFTSRA